MPIDQLTFDMEIKMKYSDQDFILDGTVICGIFLEGAKIDPQTHLIREAEPKVLYQTIPAVV